MAAQFIQLGQHTVAADSIQSIDQNYQTEGNGGRCVRVWLRSTALPGYQGPNQSPTFLDFAGRPAQTIRANMRNMAGTGTLPPTLLPAGEEEPEAAGGPGRKTATAKG